MPEPSNTTIAINAVKEDRADDFAAWLTGSVAPAVERLRAHHSERWRVLRDTQAADGVVVFAFLFEGGQPADWDLWRLLEEDLGSEGVERARSEVDDMLARPQVSWIFEPFPLVGAE